jgi:hypothetical protein
MNKEPISLLVIEDDVLLHKIQEYLTPKPGYL